MQLCIALTGIKFIPLYENSNFSFFSNFESVDLEQVNTDPPSLS
ncbi:hypothetical protein F0521_33650 [Ferrimonas sp. YFM]|nr:hypothetical protein F0521_33650 [Ferrimonas sp. YFM]